MGYYGKLSYDNLGTHLILKNKSNVCIIVVYHSTCSYILCEDKLDLCSTGHGLKNNLDFSPEFNITFLSK